MNLDLPGRCSDARAHRSHHEVPCGQEFTIVMCLAEALGLGFGWDFIGFQLFSMIFIDFQWFPRLFLVFSRSFHRFRHRSRPRNPCGRASSRTAGPLEFRNTESVTYNATKSGP